MAVKKDVDTKKEQALNDAIKQIEKQFGKGSVMKLGDRYSNGFINVGYGLRNRRISKRKNY